MAGIDKTYVTNYNDWKEIHDYMKSAEFICPNGIILYGKYYLYNSDLSKEEIEERIKEVGKIPVMNTPSAMDYFLIKYCPIKLVQDRMKNVYSEDEYNAIKNGTSEYDKFTRPVAGNKFKFITKPKFHKCSKWWHEYLKKYRHFGFHINVTWSNKAPSIYGYNEDYDIFIYHNELGYITQSGTIYTNCKSVKAVLRKIRKYKFPVGTEISFSGWYKGEYGKIIIK